MIRLALACAAVLLMVACHGFPLFSRGEGVARGAAAEGRAELELQDVRYDGEFLFGRLLVGAAEGRLRLDKRLISDVDLSVDWVWDCTEAISQPVPFMRVDTFPRPPSEEEVLILEPGYWYGGPVRLSLFPREQPSGKRNPDCVEVSLTLNGVGSGPAGRVRVRARRETPATSVDGGVSQEGGIAPESEPSPDDVNPGRVWVPFKESQ